MSSRPATTGLLKFATSTEAVGESVRSLDEVPQLGILGQIYCATHVTNTYTEIPAGGSLTGADLSSSDRKVIQVFAAGDEGADDSGVFPEEHPLVDHEDIDYFIIEHIEPWWVEMTH